MVDSAPLLQIARWNRLHDTVHDETCGPTLVRWSYASRFDD
jgi:hypothetical protein